MHDVFCDGLSRLFVDVSLDSCLDAGRCDTYPLLADDDCEHGTFSVLVSDGHFGSAFFTGGLEIEIVVFQRESEQRGYIDGCRVGHGTSGEEHRLSAQIGNGNVVDSFFPDDDVTLHVVYQKADVILVVTACE